MVLNIEGMQLPAIRGLEAFPVDAEGQMLICMRDPEGIVEGQLLLTPGAYVIAVLLNGSRSILEVQAEFAKQFEGHVVDSADIQKVVDSLDSAGFLHSERFEQLRNDTQKHFAASRIREAHLAGKSYPADPVLLREFLNSQFFREDSPGQLPSNEGSAAGPLRCLIAPHIDIVRGGHSYAHAYSRLYRHLRPELVFIFGVAHSTPPVPFILTRKDFATPFGTLLTDTAIVERLEKSCGWDPYQFELFHRTEHSIEFQAVMLSYLYGLDIKIVPILCGAFSQNGDSPGEEVNSFLNVCRSIVSESKVPVTVICGADFAHVGKRFGDPFEIEPDVIRSIENRDREDIEQAMIAGAEPFYASVMKDLNERRVCGVNCIYAALKSAGAGKGELLHYGYAHDPFGGIVSFASIAFP